MTSTSSRPVLLLIGTRPEAIKLAPVVLALREAGLPILTISSGQHRDMVQSVVDRFGVVLDADLAVMQPDQSLAGLTARLLESIDRLVADREPVLVIVQGDTTTAFAGALAAYYRRVPVAHVEAGLRTGRLDSPFPEEANRVFVGRLATLHFAPTTLAQQRLLDENVHASSIFVTGNTVIDALRLEMARQARTPIPIELSGTGPIVLITAHRRENFGTGLEQICAAIVDLATRFTDHRFVFPVHPNPCVRVPVEARLGGIGNVILLDPLPYHSLVALLNVCRLVLTDSGGLQEEAPSLGKPVLVMRDTTERVEGVEAGVVRLVGTTRATIVAETSRLLKNQTAYDEMAAAANPYGDGFAAARIVSEVVRFLNSTVPTGHVDTI